MDVTQKRTKDELYEIKLEQFWQRLSGRILEDPLLLRASYHRSREAIPLARTADLPREPIREGATWGGTWESGYFLLEGVVPQAYAGRKAVAQLDFNGEALVYSRDGLPLYGLTRGSVFAEHYAKDIYPLLRPCRGGERIEIFVEAVAHHLFGVDRKDDPGRTDPARFGQHPGVVNRIRLCAMQDEVYQLHQDIEVLLGLMRSLEPKSTHRARILRALISSMNRFQDDPRNAQSCREILSVELGKRANASAIQTWAVGHAHIDIGWLWRIRETRRKCARTFASQLALLDRVPGYVFGASQPQNYQFVKEDHPRLYERIRRAVRDKRWEPQGAMWVEADCNLISGESMVRQFVHGKGFFMDEFGVDVNHLWLPDVFGYSAALPQIIKKSGCDFFLTQKLSWSQFNQFPHHTFRWRGIDGTEVITHFPPENTYNSALQPADLRRAEGDFLEKGELGSFLTLFGIGDGGGGPKEEHLERAMRLQDLEDCPRVTLGSAAQFFDGLRQHEATLPVWEGELYLELHRGTLTTQARTKQHNRKLEQALLATEALAACLPWAIYPQAALDRLWKTLLLHQFHDILPGSSIHEVYQDAAKEYEKAFQNATEIGKRSATALFTPAADWLVLYNPGAHPYGSPIPLPGELGALCFATEAGVPIPTQLEPSGALLSLSLPPHSLTSVRRTGQPAQAVSQNPGLVLENARVRYRFDPQGLLVEAFDKALQRDFIPAGQPGNLLSLYEDYPYFCDAWDIDFNYPEQRLETARVRSIEPLGQGPVRQGLRLRLGIGRSDLEQDVYLSTGSRRLDFVTRVTWQETHRMLRVSFPVDVVSDLAAFDIQYGFVRRPTHDNTSWDEARFEVVGLRYADLSTRDGGVALLNDCKYGYRVKGAVLDLNLLRSPTGPDPDADQGEHEFTYALLPHPGELTDSEVMAEAAMLNAPPLLFPGFRSKLRTLPFAVEGPGLTLAALKKAEKEDKHVLRIVETLGRHSRGRLISHVGKVRVMETNLMEWEEGPMAIADPTLDLACRPFEIKTLLVEPVAD